MTAKKTGKSGQKSGGKKPGTFKGKDDPRNGRGPKKGAENAGRPPDWFKRKMGALVTRDDVIAFLEDSLTEPGEKVKCPKCKTVVHVHDPERYFKALAVALDRWLGKPRQEISGPDGSPVERTVIYMPEMDTE